MLDTINEKSVRLFIKNECITHLQSIIEYNTIKGRFKFITDNNLELELNRLKEILQEDCIKKCDFWKKSKIIEIAIFFIQERNYDIERYGLGIFEEKFSEKKIKECKKHIKHCLEIINYLTL